MNSNLKQTVLKNALCTVAARLWLMLVGLVLTPYILTTVGNLEFGVWILTGALIGYIGLFDLGMGTSFVKYVAEYHARGEHDSVNRIITTGFTIYLIFGALIIVATYLAVGELLRFLVIPEGIEAKARFVLELAMIGLALGNFVGLYQSVIMGLQRMDLSNAIMVVLSVVYALGCLLAMKLGFGIEGLALAQFVIQVLGIAGSAYYAYRLYPSLAFDFTGIGTHFTTLLRYGLNLQISGIAWVTNFQFDKLLINRSVDATHVTYYEIGSRMPSAARTFPALVLSVLTPAFAELETRKGKAELYGLFSRASKYMAMLCFPLFVGIIAIAQPLIQLWVGPGYDISVIVLRVLCLGYLFNIVAGTISPLVQGMGRPDYQRNAEVLSLILNVVLSTVLIIRYGFFGAAVGTSIAMSMAGWYYLWSFHRFMERPLASFVKDILLQPAFFTLPSGLLAFTACTFLLPYGSGSRMAALAVVLLAGALFVVCYVSLIVMSRYLDDRDMALFRQAVPFIRSRTPVSTLPTSR